MKRTLTHLATLAAMSAPAAQRTPPQLFGQVTHPTPHTPQRVAALPLQNRMGFPGQTRQG